MFYCVLCTEVVHFIGSSSILSLCTGLEMPLFNLLCADSEEEDVDYFEEAPANQESREVREVEVRGARDILYNDFFDPPESNTGKLFSEDQNDSECWDEEKEEGGVVTEEEGGVAADGSISDDEGGFVDGTASSGDDDGGGTSEGSEGVAMETHGRSSAEIKGDGENLSKHEKTQLMVSSVGSPYKVVQ